MLNVWIALIVVMGLFVCAAVAAVVAYQRAFKTQQEREELSTSDLHLLQESVEMLIERLKSASDEAVHEIEVRQGALQALIDRAEALNRAEALKSSGGSVTYDAQEVCRLAGEGMDEAEIARRSGFSKGEVELMLELQDARK